MFKEKFNEKKQNMSKEEELKQCKREKNSTLAGIIYTGALIVGSVVVSNTPAITNETLQFAAGTVQTVIPILCGGVGLGTINYAKIKKRCNELASQIEEARSNNPTQQDQLSEDEAVMRR